jgi:hypothetical protein
MSTYYDENFLCNSYSDELTLIDPEETNSLMAQDDGWQGYEQWSSRLEETERAAALEQYAFERRLERRSREVRLAGIAI